MKFQISDITGKRFGKLVVKSKSHKDAGGRYWWLCKCDCGNTGVFKGTYLRFGDTKSCGCYAIEVRRNKVTTHGLSNHPLYSIWAGMIQRCEYPIAESFKNYGGKGVKICKEWRRDFYCFYKWATTHGYKRGLTIDRYPKKRGNYSPSNCRWATPTQQARNQTSNKIIKIFGVSKCVAEWADISGIPAKKIYGRLYRKWPPTAAIFGKSTTREEIRQIIAQYTPLVSQLKNKLKHYGN